MGGTAGCVAFEAALEEAQKSRVPIAEDEEDEEWDGEVVFG